MRLPRPYLTKRRTNEMNDSSNSWATLASAHHRPYYLANTTASGTDGRSMCDNVRAYEAEHGRTGIEARPQPDELVALASAMPGNLDRLTAYVEQYTPTLLLTLGAEAAAFVRGTTHSAIKPLVEETLYSEPQQLRVFGRDLVVAHLVHPHLFIKRNEAWMQRHRDWVTQRGRALVAQHAQRAAAASSS